MIDHLVYFSIDDRTAQQLVKYVVEYVVRFVRWSYLNSKDSRKSIALPLDKSRTPIICNLKREILSTINADCIEIINSNS
jgi:hypothetical protein